MCFDLKLVTIELLFIVELMELNKKCQAQNEKEGNQEATNALNRVNSFSGSQTSEDFSHEAQKPKMILHATIVERLFHKKVT